MKMNDSNKHFRFINAGSVEVYPGLEAAGGSLHSGPSRLITSADENGAAEIAGVCPAESYNGESFSKMLAGIVHGARVVIVDVQTGEAHSTCLLHVTGTNEALLDIERRIIQGDHDLNGADLVFRWLRCGEHVVRTGVRVVRVLD